MDFITAGVQISSVPNDFKGNLQKVCSWYEKAVTEHKAALVIFPETVTSGFTPGMPRDEFFRTIPESIEDYLEPVRKIARSTKTYCILPTYERGPEKPCVFNSAFVIDDEGMITGVYRKTHLFPTERLDNGGWTTAAYEVPVFETKFGKIGIMICFDGDFPELVRIMALKGAGFIAHPSAFLRNHDIWDLTNRARAYDNQVYVAAVNAVGVDIKGNNYFGHSVIIDPQANRLAQTGSAEGIISAKIRNLKTHTLSYGSKLRGAIDHLGHRNIKCYTPDIVKRKI